MKYSFIVPVFNRPDEVDELLASLCSQTAKDFEVIIVEDGSKKTCKDVCEKYASILDLHYYYKENSGPGQSRNYGVERAHGQWVIILDSDVVVPPNYLESVQQQTRPQQVCWGGPDAAHPSFTPVQKAISYSMTSFFTTGGIRGGKKKMDKFYPRSFNMGIRRDVYLELGGFSKMRFGEDIDFSYRIVEAGYEPKLFPEAWVWHKRRTDFHKFFRQVYNSGIARINLEKRHPGTLKLVHLLPTVFTIGVILLILVGAFGRIMMVYGQPDDFRLWYWVVIAALSPIILYALLILIDSTRQNRSLHVGLLSIPAAFTQLMGYGLGFIESWWKRCVLGQDEFTAFEKNFYK
jgi:glycosyltransferase involved in cell wall biosynthesis